MSGAMEGRIHVDLVPLKDEIRADVEFQASSKEAVAMLLGEVLNTFSNRTHLSLDAVLLLGKVAAEVNDKNTTYKVEAARPKRSKDQ